MTFGSVGNSEGPMLEKYAVNCKRKQQFLITDDILSADSNLVMRLHTLVNVDDVCS
jgi:hypothetical protein